MWACVCMCAVYVPAHTSQGLGMYVYGIFTWDAHGKGTAVSLCTEHCITALPVCAPQQAPCFQGLHVCMYM